MTATQKKYSLVLTAAVIGLVLVCAGLSLAALSNPRRFSLDPAADAQILLLSIAGAACTTAGVGLFLTAVRQTTQSMPAESKARTNLGVGIGFALQLIAFFLLGTGQISAMLGWGMILVSLPVFVWGCGNYAVGKGHPQWIGLVGVAGVLGLVVLMVLPDRGQPAA